jgi:ABC-type antimicrobial peptide transport system permease subunit
MDAFWSTPTLSFSSATFIVRSPNAGKETFVRDLQQAVWAVNANVPLAQVRTLADVHRESLARTAFILATLAIASVMGLLLGSIGIYGVIAYSVSQRTREIGIRVALGAPVGALKRMFVRQGMVLAGAGAVTGLAAASAVTRWMSSVLFGVSPLDAATYAVVTLILIAVAALAAYVPARRSTRVDPVEALRGG